MKKLFASCAVFLPMAMALMLCGQSRPTATGNEANGVIKSTCVSGNPSICI